MPVKLTMDYIHSNFKLNIGVAKYQKIVLHFSQINLRQEKIKV